MNIERLFEAINTFEKYISPEEIQSALKTYPDYKSDRDVQLKILKDAKKGDRTAINFLYYLYKGLIAKAFWKYYTGPDPNSKRRKIAAGEDYDFASRAYELLSSGSGDKTSPFKTFKPETFSPDSDILSKFGYYFYRYLQSVAFQMIRVNKLGGLSGNVKDDVSVSEQDISEIRGAETVEDDTGSIDLNITLDAFSKTLSPQESEIFKLKRKGYSLNDIAKKMELSHTRIRWVFDQIKVKWTDYVGE